MTNPIGKLVQVKTNRLKNGKTITMRGICYGKVKSQGGWKYMVKEIQVDEEMGFRKVTVLDNDTVKIYHSSNHNENNKNNDL